MLPFFIFSACIHFTSAQHPQGSYQIACMEKSVHLEDILGGGFLNRSMLIDDHIANADICWWRGVRCEDEKRGYLVVREVHWHNYQWGCVATFRWFPSTVRILDISQQHVKERFLARMLPRALLKCTLHICGIFSQVELRGLPEGIETLRVTECGVTGTLELRELPGALRFLDFRSNQIEVVVVESIPDGLVDARFFHKTKNPIFRFPKLWKADERLHCNSEVYF